MRIPIQTPHIEGLCSRQAHADFPTQKGGCKTDERKLGQEGLIGQCTHMIHKHAPTAWIDFKGPLQPRAFDLNKQTKAYQNPWDLPKFLWNAHTDIRWWNLNESMSFWYAMQMAIRCSLFTGVLLIYIAIMVI